MATDHYIKVPLVHGGPSGGETLEIFVRELVQPSLPAPRGNRPALLYLQGAFADFKVCQGSARRKAGCVVKVASKGAHGGRVIWCRVIGN